MKLKPFLKIIIFLLPGFYFQVALAQEHVHYNNIQVKLEPHTNEAVFRGINQTDGEIYLL